MNKIETPSLRRIRSFFSSEESSTPIRQSSSQQLSPLEKPSNEAEVLSIIRKTYKIMERKDEFTDALNGDALIRKNPWIVLTKTELDDLTQNLEILHTAKKTQLFEKSFQNKCNVYKENLEKRLAAAKSILKDQELDIYTTLAMQSEIEETLTMKEKNALTKLTNKALIEKYEQAIPQMVSVFRDKLDAPLNSCIQFLSFLAATKPEPISEENYQLLNKSHSSLEKNQQLPFKFSTQSPNTIQAIDLVKETWQRTSPESPKQIKEATVNTQNFQKAYNTLREENFKNKKFQEELKKQSLGPDFKGKSLLNVLQDLQNLIKTNTNAN